MKRLALALAFVVAATASKAEWLFEGGEGSSYAFTTDGGFVDGSYQNGLKLFCRDDGSPCEFRVTLGGEAPVPPVAVAFTFSDGQTVERLAESVGGGQPQVAWDDTMIDKMMSESSVTVRFGSGPQHTFSLKGSSAAIKNAMNK